MLSNSSPTPPTHTRTLLLPLSPSPFSFAGGHSGFVEKVEYISRLKELVAGERAAIEAVQSEMTRDQQEQAEQRMNAGR